MPVRWRLYRCCAVWLGFVPTVCAEVWYTGIWLGDERARFCGGCVWRAGVVVILWGAVEGEVDVCDGVMCVGWLGGTALRNKEGIQTGDKYDAERGTCSAHRHYKAKGNIQARS